MKKFLVVLLVIVCIGLGAGVVFLKGSDDNEGPKKAKILNIVLIRQKMNFYRK